jgi:uncharacterized protein DUF3303
VLYMVVETFISGPRPVYARAAERGRMLPVGLNYVDSWVDERRLDRCFQLMETEDPALFGECGDGRRMSRRLCARQASRPWALEAASPTRAAARRSRSPLSPPSLHRRQARPPPTRTRPKNSSMSTGSPERRNDARVGFRPRQRRVVAPAGRALRRSVVRFAQRVAERTTLIAWPSRSQRHMVAARRAGASAAGKSPSPRLGR